MQLNTQPHVDLLHKLCYKHHPLSALRLVGTQALPAVKVQEEKRYSNYGFKVAQKIKNGMESILAYLHAAYGKLNKGGHENITTVVKINKKGQNNTRGKSI